MAFWGIEVKPGTPYTHRLDTAGGRIHITQATLGHGPSTKKTTVQCNIGDKRPIYLCTLLPDKIESCSLNLEFEEDDEVIFSVIGPQSVHLSGIIISDAHENSEGDSDSYDSFGEDIANTETEDDTDTDYDIEDEYGDDFIVQDDDDEMFTHSRVSNTGVIIEEIVDEEKPTKENGKSKRSKKKHQPKESEDANADDNSKLQVVKRDSTDFPVLESEDEDGFPISSPHKTKPDIEKPEVEAEEIIENGTAKEDKKKKKKKAKDGRLEPGEVVTEDDSKQERKKKKTKKEKSKEAKAVEASTGNEDEMTGPTNQALPVEDVNGHINENLVAEVGAKSSEKKKKKRKRKTQKSEGDAGEKETKMEIEDGQTEPKPSQVRTFPNGLVIEELAMGKPDGERASPGNKVSVHYIGKLKKNDQIFDSCVGRAPFKFRLGIGQVIKGWDVGVNGMRVGDKRRLTIPPSMGYGATGAGPKVPPNAWLVFDVELVAVQ